MSGWVSLVVNIFLVVCLCVACLIYGAAWGYVKGYLYALRVIRNRKGAEFHQQLVRDLEIEDEP